jgi:hypothetical protein
VAAGARHNNPLNPQIKLDKVLVFHGKGFAKGAL